MSWRHFIYVLYQTTRASFLAEEKNSSLGLIWHLLNPILMTGVDQSFRKRVEDVLTRFPSAEQIVLHASHDHELMRRTCPLAILIDGGTIRQFGPTDEVIDLYRREVD